MKERKHTVPPATRGSMRFSHMAVGAAAASMSAAIMAIANRIAGRDLALKLAYSLRLGSGVLLSAVYGGLAALWLSLGGPTRWAAFSGFLSALGAGTLLWHFGRPYAWVVEAVLTGALGQGGSSYTGLVVLLMVILTMRWVAESVTAALELLFDRWMSAAHSGS